MARQMTTKEKRQGYYDHDGSSVVAKGHTIPEFTGIPSGCIQTPAGLVIEIGAAHTIPLSSLPKMQYLRKLATERRRIRKELARLGESLDNPKRCRVCGVWIGEGSNKHPLPPECRRVQMVRTDAAKGYDRKRKGARARYKKRSDAVAW